MTKMSNTNQNQASPAQAQTETTEAVTTKAAREELPSLQYEEELQKAAIERIDERLTPSNLKSLIDKQIQPSQIRYTEVLGVFVALFTFVSINIQIFNKVTSLNNALIFTTLMFVCLTAFVAMLHLILTSQRNFLLIFSIVTICGLILIPVFLVLLPQTPLSIEESFQLEQIKQRLSNLETALEILLQTRN